ncbi:MAG: FAD-dependent oxidoreductase [Bacillota bacterium]
MKVAIIGAGTAGLSCAIELERNGIHPTIFERNDFIGEYHPHVSAMLDLIVRPAEDPIKFLDHKLGIKLKPLNKFKKVIHYSPNNEVAVTGQLGYFLIRGKEENSVKNQLHHSVKSQVHFNCFVQPEDIQKNFDYIVVADGHWTAPKRYGIWQEVMRTWVKGGIFAGDFEEDTLKMWLDNELTHGVYIYSAPYSKNKGVIAHVVQNIRHEELNAYWHRFLESREILKKYDLLETWELPHHAGTVSTNKVGKVFFVGTAGGGVEPFLGFGQFNAIFSGVMAAKSIVKGIDINPLLKGLRKKSNDLLVLRKLLNAATNKDFDRLLTAMKTPGFRSLVYKTNIDIIKILSFGLKPLISNQKAGGGNS